MAELYIGNDRKMMMQDSFSSSYKNISYMNNPINEHQKHLARRSQPLIVNRKSSFVNSFALLIIFCLLFGGNAKADDLLVADATGTNSSVPIYGLYTDDNYQHTQTIYPSSLLTQMQGGSITKLTYYLKSACSDAWGATFEVRLGTTTQSSFSSGTVSYISMTGSANYSGVINNTNSNKLIEITLSTPYTYTSGNLIVDVRLTSLGSGYEGKAFYGESGSTYYSIQSRNSSSVPNSTGSAVSFMPKTTFTYTTPVTAPTVTTSSTIANLTSASVTLGGQITSMGGASTVTAGVCYGTANPPTTSNSHIESNYTSIGTYNKDISGLTAGTRYYYRAFAYNSANSLSSPSYGSTYYFDTPVIPCTPTWTGSASQYITNFKAKVDGASTYAIDNTTTGSANSYSDYFGNYAITAEAGSTILYNTTANVSSTWRYGLWIDWNKDGDFADSEEQIYMSSSYITITEQQFTIPVGTTAGSYRMRVIIDYYGTGYDLLPCGANRQGECEDYKLIVTAATTPTYTATPSVTSTCGTESFTISVSPAGSTYQWQYKNGSNDWVSLSSASSSTGAAPMYGAGGYSGAKSQTITIYSHPANVSNVQWRCLVNGVASNAVTVNYHSLPSVSITDGNSSTKCSGTTHQLTANVSSGTSPYTTYNWSTASVPTGTTSGLTPANSSSINVTPSNTNTTATAVRYRVSVTDNAGCANTATIDLTVKRNPSPEFTPDEITLTVGDTYDATTAVHLSADGCSSPTWSTSDGSIASVSAGTVTAAAAGTATITATYAEATNYCAASADLDVIVNAASSGGDCAEVPMGSGDGTNSYLPTYILYNYSLTQQIYTASEIGNAGTIQRIGFYAKSTATRNLDVYMVATNKETFANTTDWITVSAADLVFSGSVSFDANAWTTIELTNTFVYDGTQNIALIVDDNTGTWTSSISFSTYNATSQAIRVYSDGTNYDPESPSGYTGTKMDVKNQVKFCIVPPVSVPDDFCVDFESGAMPDGWTSEGSSSWSVGTGDYSTSTGAHNGTYNVKITHGTSGNVTYLVSPEMDLSAVTSATLNFWYVNRSWTGDIDEFGVYYRVNGGAWTELFSTDEEHSSWTEQSVTLEGFAANYQIGFKFTDHWGYGVGLDDICFTFEGGSGPTYSVPVCFDFAGANTTDQNGVDSGLPAGWDRVYPGSNTGYAPSIHNGSTISCVGSDESLLLCSGNDNEYRGPSIAIMPVITGIVNGTVISFDYRYNTDNQNSGTLKFGYMLGGTFNELQTLTPNTSCVSSTYTMTSDLPSGARLAFQYNQTQHSMWFWAAVDNICINPPCGSIVYYDDFGGNNVQDDRYANPTLLASASPEHNYTSGGGIIPNTWMNAGDFTHCNYLAGYQWTSSWEYGDCRCHGDCSSTHSNVYAINKNTYHDASGNGWAANVSDHTFPGDRTRGYMLQGDGTGVFYQTTLNNVPAGDYTLSAWFMNVASSSATCSLSVSGDATATTGYASITASQGVWEQKSCNFTLNATGNITITLQANGDFAVDDVLVAPRDNAPPVASISLDYVCSPTQHIEHSISDGGTATVSGTHYSYTTSNANGCEYIVEADATWGNFRIEYYDQFNCSPSSDHSDVDYVPMCSSTTIRAASECSGSCFKKWATIANGGGTAYMPGDVITPTSNLRLFAIYDNCQTCSTIDVDGSGTSQNENFPSYSATNYSLTQQIYTPCEIGKQGTIKSISFYNSGSTKNRIYDVFIKQTNTESYGSPASFIPVASTDRVTYTNVTMSASGWTTIYFLTPFEYDGTSNLVVTIDDNTGTASSGMRCYTYSTSPVVQAVYATSASDINPASLPAAVTSYYKNRIKFGICDQATLPSVNIQAFADPVDGGTITGTGSIAMCSTATLTATPNNGYTFVNWTEDDVEVSTDATYSFTVTGARALVAHFETNENSYIVDFETAALDQFGFVNDATYPWVVTDCSNSTTSVTPYEGDYCMMSGNYNVHSTESSMQMTVDFISSGSISFYWLSSGEGSTYDYGKFYVNGTQIATTTSASWNQYTYNVESAGTYTFKWAYRKDGSVSSNDDRLYVDKIVLTGSGYFVNVVPNPLSCGGNSVTVGNNGAQGAFVTSGSNITATATPPSNYTFSNWTENSSVVSSNASYAINSITANHTIVANFTPNTYQISVSANPNEGGTATGGGTYSYGGTCTVTATPQSCYKFVSWTEGGVVVSNTATYSFTVTGARTLVANFEQWSVEVASDPVSSECVTNGSEVVLRGRVGSPATLNMDNGTFELFPGYSFSYYDHNGPDANYSNNEDYTQTFTSITNSPISITFSSVSTESSWDYLYLYDGANTDGILLLSHSGSISTETTYTATSGSLTIKFTSDGSSVYSGWTATISVGGATYNWGSGSTSSATHTVSPTGLSNTYNVSVTVNGCTKQGSKTITTIPTISSVSSTAGETICEGNSTRLSVSSNASVEWNHDAGTATEINITPDDDITYTVTASANGCSTSSSIDIVVKNKVNPIFENRGPYCLGETPLSLPTTSTIDLVTNAAVIGSWNPSAINTTNSGVATYTFNASGCANDAVISVRIDPPAVDGVDLTSFDYIWSGATNTNWNTASNWFLYSDGTYSVASSSMPTTDAKNYYIGSGTCFSPSNWPSLNANATVNNVTIDAGSLTIPSGRTLSIAGSVAGPLNALENSTIVLCGANDQTLSDAATFYNVTFAQTTDGKKINVPNGITVETSATFTNGVVVGPMTFDLGATVAGTVSKLCYVDGKVTKKGNCTFAFPTGSNGVLGTFAATITNSPASGVSVRFNNASASGGFSQGAPEYYPRWWNVADNCYGNDPQFDHVSNVECWKLDGVTGNTSLNGITVVVDADDATAHFHDNETSMVNANISVAAHYNCWKNIGGSTEIENGGKKITVSGVSLQATREVFDGTITLGSKDHETWLPIELTSFTATCDGRSSLVEWTTATERNNDYFSLERSEDAINFTEIARLAGAGNSIEPIDYSYTDYGIQGGDNYYRLVQVDYDGTRTASEIIVANCIEPEVGEPDVQAYPNPFNDELTVVLDNFGNRAATIEVYDMLGKLIYTNKIAAPQNSYETILNLSNLPSGAYNVRVSTNDFVINKNVVKR